MAVGWGARRPRGLIRARRTLRRCVIAVALATVSVGSHAHVAVADSALCQPATGVVRDIYGSPLAGVGVVATSDCGTRSSAITDAAGQFTVHVVPAVTGTNAAASKADYATQSHPVQVGSLSSNDFVLPFKVLASLQPSVVQPGETIAVSADSTAPAPTANAGYVCAAGDNGSGELGVDGEGRPWPGAVRGVGGVGELDDVASISAGRQHALARRSDGTVVAWGRNANGQLGDGTTTNRYSPIVVKGVGGTGSLTNVTTVAATADSTNHSFSHAVRSDGTVVGWGSNYMGQLGDGTTTDRNVPVVVAGVGGTGTLSGVVAVANYYAHALAVRSDGTVVAWGSNAWGELGDGSTTDSPTPVVVRGVGGVGTLGNVVAVAASSAASYALRSDGTVVAWGSNVNGDLGDGSFVDSTTPVVVSGVGGSGSLSGVTAIAAAGRHAVALRSDGSVVGWGANDYGSVGDGTTVPRRTPVQVVGVGGTGTLGGVIAVSAGEGTTLALRNDGTAVGWGFNLYGELGNGSTLTTTTPTVVVGPGGNGTLMDLLAVGVGESFSVFRRANPCAAPRSTSRAITQLPTGGVIELAQGSTTGTSTAWSGSLTVSAGTPDGVYVTKVCGVDQAFKANCDAAGQHGVPFLTTQIVPLSYLVDGTPPAVTQSAPSAFAAIDATTTLSVTWSDAGAGIDPSSVTLAVDGQPLSVTTAGPQAALRVSATSSALGPGVHVVESTASDLAGNAAAAHSFVFTLVSVSTGAANATLAEMEIPVPLAATKVTFNDPPVAIGGFDETINASTRAGYSTLRRAFAFGTATVEFRGVNTVTTQVPIPPRHAPHDVAALMPFASAATAKIDPSTVLLPDLVVDVPVGFIPSSNSVAVLRSTTASLGSTTSATGTYFSTDLPARVPVFASVSTCRSNAAAGGAQCTQSPGVAVVAVVAGVRTPAFAVVNQDPDTAFDGTAPSCPGCAGSPASAASRVRVGCGHWRLPDNSSWDLCTGQSTSTSTAPDGAFALYLNSWVFPTTHGRSASWQQSRTVASSAGDRCPNGRQGSVTARTFRTVNTTRSLDGIVPTLTVGTYFPGPTPFAVKLGIESGPTPGSVANGYALYAPTAETYQIAIDPSQLTIDPMTGAYDVRSGGTHDLLGGFTADSVAASNRWEASAAQNPDGSEVTGTVRLTAGTQFGSPAVNGQYAITSTLGAQLVLSTTCS